MSDKKTEQAICPHCVESFNFYPREANKQIAELEAKLCWIPVTTELPEPGTFVLIGSSKHNVKNELAEAIDQRYGKVWADRKHEIYGFDIWDVWWDPSALTLKKRSSVDPND